MMTIDWQHLTPWTSLLGGALIGLATLFFILFNGRIAGISGIISGLIKPNLKDIDWRIAFLLGLLVSPLLWQLFVTLPTIEIQASNPLLIVSGYW